MSLPETPTFRIVAISATKGVREILCCGLAHDEAGKMYWQLSTNFPSGELLIEREYADTDSSDAASQQTANEPTSQGKRSVELFPAITPPEPKKP